MSKKTFKGANPALQFITQEEGKDEQTGINPASDVKKPNDKPTDNAGNTDITHNTDNTNMTHNAQEADNTRTARRKARTGDGEKPRTDETKSKRINLLIQPSVIEDMGKIAHMKQTSVNDLINTVLKNYVKREASTISKYEDVFGSTR